MLGHNARIENQTNQSDPYIPSHEYFTGCFVLLTSGILSKGGDFDPPGK